MQETLKGTLDGVMDGSQSVVHIPITRTPVARNLAESNPEIRRKSSRHIDMRNGPPPASISHLTTATLTGGFEGSPVRQARGKKIMPNATAAQQNVRDVNIPLSAAAIAANLKGKRHYDPTSHAAVAAPPSKVAAPPFASEVSLHHVPPPPPHASVFHKRPVKTAPNDTPGILRFSPRFRVGTSSGSAATTAAVPAARPSMRPSTAPMRSILSWTGATPRYTGHRQSAVARVIQPPSEVTTKTSAKAPYDAPFSTAAAARLDTYPIHSQSGRRPRGTGKVESRPKSARGLLSWSS